MLKIGDQVILRKGVKHLNGCNRCFRQKEYYRIANLDNFYNEIPHFILETGCSALPTEIEKLTPLAILARCMEVL